MKANFNADDLVDMKDLANGNEVAFQSLYNSYYPAVYGFILNYVHSPDLAEDLCQEVFMKVWNARLQLMEVRSLKAYIFTIARNHTLNSLRKALNSKSVMRELLTWYPTNDKTTENEVQLKEYDHHLQETLNGLSPMARQVFKLCREECRTYEEAAEQLGVSRNAIKKHMVQTMKVLKGLTEGSLEINLSISFLVFYYFLTSFLFF